jgi:hypothetical protein
VFLQNAESSLTSHKEHEACLAASCAEGSRHLLKTIDRGFIKLSSVEVQKGFKNAFAENFQATRQADLVGEFLLFSASNDSLAVFPGIFNSALALKSTWQSYFMLQRTRSY